MRIRLKVEGNKAAIKALDTASKEATNFLEEEIHKTGEDILIKAQNRVPVDTGFLKNSGYEIKEQLSSEVGFRVHYSPYVEFGTGGLVDVPSGLENYAIQFKGAGIKQVNLPPRPFLFNSAFEEQQKLIERLKQAFNGTQ